MKLFKHTICYLCFIIAIFSLPIFAAPESKLIPFWNHSDENNSNPIDHSLWQSVLNQHLKRSNTSGVNLVDYANLKKNSIALNTYLTQLQQLDPRQFSRAEQKAFWINLYNASTVKLIVENYPISSILKIKSALFSFGPWNKKWITVAEQPLSLNDIEHGILRPIWQDNRIHYAVNCASFSCPNLSPKAFTKATTEDMLNSLAQEYINHPRGLKIQGSTIVFSSIYDWYKVDFGNSNNGLIEHWQQFAKPELLKQLKEIVTLDSFKLDHQYDWRLNELVVSEADD